MHSHLDATETFAGRAKSAMGYLHCSVSAKPMHLSSQLHRLHGFTPGFLAVQPSGPTPAASLNEQAGGWWPILRFTWERCEAFGWDKIGTYLLIATALSVLLLWPFARMIVGRKQVLGRSVLFVGSVIALSVAFLALSYFALLSESMAVLVAVGAVYAAVLLAQTRHVFDAPRAAAAGVLGCYLVVTGVALYGTEQLTGPMPWTEFLFKPKEEQRRIFAEWETGRKERPSVAATNASPAANPAVNPAEKPAVAPANTPAATATTPPPAPAPPGGAPNLQALYVQLQKTRAELDTSDAAAVGRFNQQAAAYEHEKALAAALASRTQHQTGKSERSEPAQPAIAVQNSRKPSRK